MKINSMEGLLAHLTVISQFLDDKTSIWGNCITILNDHFLHMHLPGWVW